MIYRWIRYVVSLLPLGISELLDWLIILLETIGDWLTRWGWRIRGY